MTIEEIVDVTRFVLADKLPGKVLRIEELNGLFKLVDYDIIQDLYGTSSSPEGYETSGQRGDALLPLKTSTSIVLTSGLGTLPTDYLHWGRCYYVSGTDQIPVELVTAREREQRQFNAVTRPTSRHPIVELVSSTQLQVYPTTIASITLAYIKKPTPAVFGLTSENGIDVYSAAGSTQPLWKEQNHIDYIRHLLKYLGLAVDNQFIISYTEQKQAQTT